MQLWFIHMLVTLKSGKVEAIEVVQKIIEIKSDTVFMIDPLVNRPYYHALSVSAIVKY